jgi:hypothetical protein
VWPWLLLTLQAPGRHQGFDLGGGEVVPGAGNCISEQSRAGMPDEGLGIAGIGLEHLQTAVAGHVGDLDQVGAALHRGGHEAGAQAVAGKGCGLEPELGGGSLDDGRDVARRGWCCRTSIRSSLCSTGRAMAPAATSDEDDFGASESGQQVRSRPSRAQARKRGDMDDEIPF